MSAIAVHLNTSLLFILAVCITADMRTTIQQNDLQAQFGRCLFCNGQTEKAGSDNHEIRSHYLLLYVMGTRVISTNSPAVDALCKGANSVVFTAYAATDTTILVII